MSRSMLEEVGMSFGLQRAQTLLCCDGSLGCQQWDEDGHQLCASASSPEGSVPAAEPC